MNQTLMFKLLMDDKKTQEILNRISGRKRKVMLLMKGCQKLPDDIIRKIYEEHFKPEFLFEDLVYIFMHISSRRLDSNLLKNFMPKLLNNKILLVYLLKNDGLFNEIYTNHIIHKKNTYVNVNSAIDSMAITWLAFLYH